MASHLFKIATFLISEYHHFIAVVQSFTCVQLFATPWPAAHQASLSFTNSQSFLKLTSIESIMPSNHLILCCPLLLLPLVFPRIRVFPMSQLFTSGDKSIGASASASVLPMNIHDWFPLELTDLICLLPKGLSRVFSSTMAWITSSSVFSLLYVPTVSYAHDYWKNHNFDYMDLCWQSDISTF